MARKRKKQKDFFSTIEYGMLMQSTPLCEHFGMCGGCRFQDIAYQEQLELKEQYLETIFSKKVPIHAAPQAYAYRNRMDFIVHENRLSLRKRGDFTSIIPITKCELVPLAFQQAQKRVQELLDTYSFSSYNIETKQGFLRYITFRYAPATKQLMIICTTSEHEENGFEGFLNLLAEFATSVYWFVNDTLTDVSIPEVSPKIILGQTYIEDELLGTRLRYGPHSFFQSNTAMAEIAFSKMAEFVSGNTLDVCCGVGSIALLVEQKAKSVLGVEVVDEAIQFAKQNALLSSSKAIFFTADMKNLKDYAPLEVDTVILDPPRPGVGKKPLKRILELDPKRIVYLSCNPKTQAIDLDIIKELGGEYTVLFHEAYDFFPQTPHVESLLVLEKIE